MEANPSLMELLEGVHDPRGARGKRHPLPTLLALAVVALLAGMTSYEAFFDYGKERGEEFCRLLGFTRRRGHCKATSSRVFRRIDVADFEALSGQWSQGQLGPATAPHLAIDGHTGTQRAGAALELLGVLPVKDKVSHRRRQFTHRDVCTVVDRGGALRAACQGEPADAPGRHRGRFATPEAGLSPLRPRTAGRADRPGRAKSTRGTGGSRNVRAR